MEPVEKRGIWFGWVIFLLLVALVTVGILYLSRHQPKFEASQPGLYRVVKFDDGDTIVVDMNGTNETVRFIGVDTPETHDPRKPLQCYGQEAAVFTKQLIGSQSVRLQADPLDTNRDRYGRLLRYVYLPDGTLLDKQLIAQGYGFAYTFFPFVKKTEFKIAELQARKDRRGLWAACQVKALSSGQKQTSPAQ